MKLYEAKQRKKVENLERNFVQFHNESNHYYITNSYIHGYKDLLEYSLSI